MTTARQREKTRKLIRWLTRKDTHDDIGVEPDRGSSTGTPHWVKVFGIIVAVVVLLGVARMFIGGEQGSARHAPSGGGRG